MVMLGGSLLLASFRRWWAGQLLVLMALLCVETPVRADVLPGTIWAFPTLFDVSGVPAIAFTEWSQSSVRPMNQPRLLIANDYCPKSASDWHIDPINGFNMQVWGDCSGARYIAAASNAEVIVVVCSSSLNRNIDSEGIEGAELAWRHINSSEWHFLSIDCTSSWGDKVEAVAADGQIAIAVSDSTAGLIRVFLFDYSMTPPINEVYRQATAWQVFSFAAADDWLELATPDSGLTLACSKWPHDNEAWRYVTMGTDEKLEQDGQLCVFGDTKHIYVATSSNLTHNAGVYLRNAQPEEQANLASWRMHKVTEDTGEILGTVLKGKPLLLYNSEGRAGSKTAYAKYAAPGSTNDWLFQSGAPQGNYLSLFRFHDTVATASFAPSTKSICFAYASIGSPSEQLAWHFSTVLPKPKVMSLAWVHQNLGLVSLITALSFLTVTVLWKTRSSRTSRH